MLPISIQCVQIINSFMSAAAAVAVALISLHMYQDGVLFQLHTQYEMRAASKEVSLRVPGPK